MNNTKENKPWIKFFSTRNTSAQRVSQPPISKSTFIYSVALWFSILKSRSTKWQTQFIYALSLSGLPSRYILSCFCRLVSAILVSRNFVEFYHKLVYPAMIGKVQGVQDAGKFICQSKKLKEETMINVPWNSYFALNAQKRWKDLWVAHLSQVCMPQACNSTKPLALSHVV